MRRIAWTGEVVGMSTDRPKPSSSGGESTLTRLRSPIGTVRMQHATARRVARERQINDSARLDRSAQISATPDAAITTMPKALMESGNSWNRARPSAAAETISK